MKTLHDLKEGDRVIRELGQGGPRMVFTISTVDESTIYIGGPEGWKFDRATGAEIDEDLGWGPPPLMTGSCIVPAEDSQVASPFEALTQMLRQMRECKHITSGEAQPAATVILDCAADSTMNMRQALCVLCTAEIISELRARRASLAEQSASVQKRVMASHRATFVKLAEVPDDDDPQG